MTVVRSVCGMCGNDACGIEVEVEDNRIISIRGNRAFPLNEGRLCVQALAAGELQADPARLSYPLARRARGGDWQRITWDEALDRIAERLADVKARAGAPSFVLWEGEAMGSLLDFGWDQRFLNLYGSPNWAQHDHMCYLPSVIAEQLTYGKEQVDGFEAEHTACIVLWGSNPATSHSPYKWHAVQRARRRGAKLAVVDPFRTQPAAMADLYLRPRPGTDAALALALIHVLIAERLYDADFVTAWTTGFDALAERVQRFTPEWAAGVTGVPAADIHSLAAMMASARPAHLDVGNAVEHHSNAGQALRSLMIVRALTGNLDVPGGNVLQRDLPVADIRLRERLPRGLQPLGFDRYPLFVAYAGFVPGDVLLDAILDGRPYRVTDALVMGTNPAVTWPNSRRVQAALARLDMLVVMDLFMTPTAELADIVLPAASSYEKVQLIAKTAAFGADQPMWWVALRPELLDPGERRSEWWVLAELGRRLGYAADYPWATQEEAIGTLLEPLGLTLAQLKAHPDGLYWGDPADFGAYRRTGFHTPSGKVELSSHILAAYGYDPLPDYHEPAESPAGNPELARDYPLVLNAGRRTGAYTHSRYRSLPSLRKRVPEPMAEIHPETASACGVADRDRIVVETLRGRVELTARVTEDIVPGVVAMLPGWAEANANLLTDDRQTDPVFATPALRSALCRVRRA